MEIGDKLSLGLMTTGLGVLVVFVALVAIIAIVAIMSLIMRERKSKKEETKPAPPVKAQANIAETAATGDDDDLVVVLSAAAACYIQDEKNGKTPTAPNTTGLVVRPYKKSKNASAWGRAGRSAQIYNKF